jgi:hypothetical protein
VSRGVLRWVQCSGCPKLTRKRKVYPNAPTKCAACQAAGARERTARWRDAHKLEALDRAAKWAAEHPEKMREHRRRWAEKHHARTKRRARIAARLRRKQAKALLAGLPCMECGQQHTEQLRERILRRMLPCTSQEIHEAWDCIWGPAGFEFKGSAGSQMLRKDLQRIGATSIKRGEYVLVRAA